MSKPTLEEAIGVLIDALKEDKTNGSYYFGWQSNIAMAFYDEYLQYHERNNIPVDKPIHSIANAAAQRFLDQLIQS